MKSSSRPRCTCLTCTRLPDVRSKKQVKPVPGKLYKLAPGDGRDIFWGQSMLVGYKKNKNNKWYICKWNGHWLADKELNRTIFLCLDVLKNGSMVFLYLQTNEILGYSPNPGHIHYLNLTLRLVGPRRPHVMRTT